MMKIYILSLYLFIAFSSKNDGEWQYITTSQDSEALPLANAWTKFTNKYGVHKMDDPSPQGVLSVCSNSGGAGCATTDLITHRFTLFKKAYDHIAAHNQRYHAGEVSYRLEINEFADLSSSELKMYLGGDKFGRPEGLEIKDTIDLDNELPQVGGSSSVDWRTDELAIKNQGQCGSCWAFASSAMIENRLHHSSKWSSVRPISNQELVDCVSGSFGCMGGFSYLATGYVADYGIASNSSYSYLAKRTNWFNACKRTSHDRYIEGGALTNGYAKASGESNMAKIVAQGAMTIALDVVNDFMYLGSDVFSPSSCSSASADYLGAHAIAVVGYTDDYWIIQNSWGTSWGDDGYAYIKRGKNVCGLGYWDNWSWVTYGSSQSNILKGADKSEEAGTFWNKPEIFVAGVLIGVAIMSCGMFGTYKCKSRGYSKLEAPAATQAISIGKTPAANPSAYHI